MQRRIIFLILILSLMALGWAAGLWYDAKEAQQRASQKVDGITNTYTLLPRSDFITVWRTNVGGVVVSVSTQSLTIKNGGKTLEFALTEGIKVEKRFAQDGAVVNTAVGLSVGDIQIGDRITVVVIADTDGDFSVEKLIILER